MGVALSRFWTKTGLFNNAVINLQSLGIAEKIDVVELVLVS